MSLTKEIIDKNGSLVGKKTIDFITGDSLNNEDMEAINKWSHYFKRKGVPFKVVKSKREVKLIKRKNT